MYTFLVCDIIFMCALSKWERALFDPKKVKTKEEKQKEKEAAENVMFAAAAIGTAVAVENMKVQAAVH